MFRRVLILAALVLGCGVSVSAQGFRIGDAQPVSSSLTSSSPITPLQASVNVCVNPANAVPCTNKASTFTSVTLVTGCSATTQVVLAGTTTCVTQTDVRGNWGAWVAAGNYDITFTLSTGQSFGPYTISVGIPSGTALSTFTSGKINGVCIVDGVQNATLAAAVTCAGSSGVIEIPMFSVPSFTTATIPNGVTLKFDGPSCLNNSGTLTINGPIQAPPVQIFCGSGSVLLNAAGAFGPGEAYQIEASWFPGANLGVSINNAAAAIPNGHRRIHVSAGSYTVPLGVISPSTDVRIVGDGQTSTIINFTGASGIAVLFGLGPAGGGYNEWGTGLEDIQLIGPGGVNGGVGNAGTGIQIGQASHSHIGTRFDQVRVAGFSIGVTWGSCSSWASKFYHSEFLNNTQELVHTICSGGANTENVSFDHTVFSQFSIAMQANSVNFGGTGFVEADFIDCSFDGDQVVNNGGNRLTFIRPHFEDTSIGVGTLTNAYYIQNTSASANTYMVNPIFLQDGTNATMPTALVTVATGNFNAQNVQGNNNSATSIAYFNIAGTSGFNISMSQSSGTFTTTTGTNAGYNIICPDLVNNCTNQGNNATFSTNSGGTNGGKVTVSGATAGFFTPNLLCSPVAPTVTSGFNAGTLGAQNGTCDFVVNVGTGTAGSTGVIGLPPSTGGWNCYVWNFTRAALVGETGTTTTSATITNYGTTFAATNWTNSDILLVTCSGH